MSRPRTTGRTAKSTSVSIKAHIQIALEDHHISPTRALDQWYDWVLDHEAALYESQLIEARENCVLLEKKLTVAKDRERKIAENQLRGAH